MRLLEAALVYPGSTVDGGNIYIMLPSVTARSRCSLHGAEVLATSAPVLGWCRCSMWAHMTLFYASGPDLAVAWSYIAAAQPLAQVSPAPAYAMACPDIWERLLGMLYVDAVPESLLGVVTGHGGAHRDRAAADRCLLPLHVTSVLLV